MVLPIGPNKREFNNLMRWRDRNNARHSLDQIVRQHSNRNDRDTNTDYIPNGMTAEEWQNHLESVDNFKQWYNNRGIKRVVEKNQGVFRRALNYLVATGLTVSLLATACLGSGTKEAYNANPTPQSTPTATHVPATATLAPINSYDFGKSLGLDADYLKEVRYDDNAKELVRYLSSMPLQIRNIAELSGLIKKLDDKQTASGVVDDKQITLDELNYFKRVIDSYKKEIETLKPWLAQLPENEVTAALALNLRNFIDAGYLKNERMPSLLPPAIFFADGIKRMYEDEIIFGDKWGHAINPHANAAVKNITYFLEIQKKAWEVANSPDAEYNGRSIDKILFQGYLIGESVGSTDKGINAHEDMKILWEQGSPAAKAALSIYARNLTREGRQGSAPQVRVELTEIDLWSIGMSSYLIVLDAHDVPTIPLKLDDIALLKNRSADPLLILEIDGKYHIPLQWTRTSIIRPYVTYFTIPDGIGRKQVKIADLKPY